MERFYFKFLEVSDQIQELTCTYQNFTWDHYESVIFWIDVLKDVKQIEADICEIYLILLRTCREFNSFNSDFHVFPKKQEMITVNSQAQ